MVIRKLGRKEAQAECGAEDLVSGGVADPLGREQADQPECGAEELVSGGLADPLWRGEAPGAGLGEAECGSDALVTGGIANPVRQQQEGGDKESDKQSGGGDQRRRWAVSPSKRLERSTGEVIAAFHQAKQELAKEMEANLKQLKAVLQETQRIAKEMEAVLREAKNEPDPQELAQGGKGKQWNPPKEQKQETERQKTRGRKEKAAWEPPDYKEDGGGDEDPPRWQPPDTGGDQRPHAH